MMEWMKIAEEVLNGIALALVAPIVAATIKHAAFGEIEPAKWQRFAHLTLLPIWTLVLALDIIPEALTGKVLLAIVDIIVVLLNLHSRPCQRCTDDDDDEPRRRIRLPFLLPERQQLPDGVMA